MTVTARYWKNKNGTGGRSCKCGSWKQHWINNSDEKWPSRCSVLGCYNDATLGAHVINTKVSGEFIIPACSSCNGKDDSFDLKAGIILISASKSKTCEQ